MTVALSLSLSLSLSLIEDAYIGLEKLASWQVRALQCIKAEMLRLTGKENMHGIQNDIFGHALQHRMPYN